MPEGVNEKFCIQVLDCCAGLGDKLVATAVSSPLCPVNRYFVSFAQLLQQPTIVVDSVGRGPHAGHWRGAAMPVPLRDDPSAGSALRALHHPATPVQEARALTANHFDIDGFIGIWSLLHPELAGHHEALLHLVAALGDFREIEFFHPLTHPALQLVAWLNTQEKAHFYEPFGASARHRREDAASAEKFQWFLPRFAEMLEKPEASRTDWQPESDRVQAAVAQLRAPPARRRHYPKLAWRWSKYLPRGLITPCLAPRPVLISCELVRGAALRAQIHYLD